MLKQKFSSLQYWRKRYAAGQNSGDGSYGRMADFKAKTLNSFVEEHRVSSCLELGCGDGNQLALLNIPKYLGLDVSPEAIDMCAAKFAADTTKSFALYDPRRFVNHSFVTADLTLSMDVILHLVEDDLYHGYMAILFAASTRYVAIFNTATDEQPRRMAAHNRFRDHAPWVAANAPEFRPLGSVPVPGDLGYPKETCFWFYEKAAPGR